MVRSLGYCFPTSHGAFLVGAGASTGPSARSASFVGHLPVCNGKKPRSFSSAPLLDTLGPIALDDGSVLWGLSDGGPIPVEQHFPLSPLPPFDSTNSNFVPRKGDDGDGSMANVQTPKRPGVDLEAPSTRRARTSTQEEKGSDELEAENFGGGDFRSQHGFSGWKKVDTIELAEVNFDHAVRFPVLRRPAFQVLVSDVGPGVHLMRRISNMDLFRRLLVEHSFTRQRGKDPISAASADAEAQSALRYDFRLLNGERQSECPVVGTQNEVCALPERRIRNLPNTT